MKVLIVGADVVGTVYGAHLAAAGNAVSVLSHEPRTDEVAAGGLRAREITGGGLAEAEAAAVPDASGNYDIILVAVRRDQLASACAGLTDLAGSQRSCSWATTRQAGLPSLAAFPVTSTSDSLVSAAC
jgi:2-dehydropantoate 2-reductase